MKGANLIAINLGNTRVQVGKFVDGELLENQHFAVDDSTPLVQTILSWWESVMDLPRAAILLASVNGPPADKLSSLLEDQLSVHVYRVGEDVPVPIAVQLDPETITGVDRLLNAAAAYDCVKQACVIIDAGTAVTVDFVDGEGTFHGGAIAPGPSLQLKAMHDYTHALPEIEFAKPDEESAFGRSTAQAMLKGVYHGVRGMVWRLVEIYAEQFGAYPQVIATGGDSMALFDDDELIDNVVPHLTLLGIASAARHALMADEHDDSDVPA